MPARGGEPVRFTYNDKSDRAPQWSPDGRQIAFLSQRGESTTTQIYVIPITGGEAMQVTKAETSVSAFRWSPDGSRIAYVVTDPKTKEETQAEREGRDWTVADRNYKHARLYVVDLKTKESRRVINKDLTVHEFDWSPDGKQFVVGTTETPLVDDAYMRVKIHTVSSEGGEPRLSRRRKGRSAARAGRPTGSGSRGSARPR